MSQNTNPIFEKGDQAPADYFTGTAWVKLLVPNNPIEKLKEGQHLSQYLDPLFL